MKILLKRFHLNGHTIGFHPQTQKLELRTKQIVPPKSLHFNGHRKFELGGTAPVKEGCIRIMVRQLEVIHHYYITPSVRKKVMCK